MLFQGVGSNRADGSESSLIQQLLLVAENLEQISYGAAAGEGYYACFAAFQGSDLGLQHRGGGVGQAGVDIAALFAGKAPSALTLAESAVIASLPYAPSSLNPLENPEGCKKRQLLVLSSMLKYGLINQGQLAEAKAERIRLTNGTFM